MFGMDIDNAMNEKFDLIVDTIKEFKEDDQIINKIELTVFLMQTYEKILPLPAKMMVRPEAFLNACMKREDDLLKAINKDARKSMFSIVT